MQLLQRAEEDILKQKRADKLYKEEQYAKSEENRKLREQRRTRASILKEIASDRRKNLKLKVSA
jgi:hypothetical protein